MADQETSGNKGIRNLDLLLIGKSGHGKSSTGNSILGRREFVSSKSTETQIKYQVGHTVIDEREVKVMDIPGLYNPSFKSIEASVNDFIDVVKDHLKHWPAGFDAMILVLSYTARMTVEEKEAITTLKSILGDDIIGKHSVCVLTHGDSFYNDHDDADLNFQTWCQDSGIYRELFEESEERFILFDNMTRDPKEKKTQLNELFSKIDSLKDNHPRYTIDDFEAAEKPREELKKKLKLPSILESLSKELASIRTEFEKVSKEGSLEQLSKLETMLSDLKNKVPQSPDDRIVELEKEIKHQYGFIIAFKTLLLEREKQRLETERVKKDVEVETKKRENEHMSHQGPSYEEQQNEGTGFYGSHQQNQVAKSESVACSSVVDKTDIVVIIIIALILIITSLLCHYYL